MNRFSSAAACFWAMLFFVGGFSGASASCCYPDGPYPSWLKATYGYGFDGPHGGSPNNPSGTTLDALADKVDVQAVANQAVELGASFVLIQLGWTTGAYASHNEIYDSIAARQGLRLTPKRDLISDLADALKAKGLHCGVELATDGPKFGNNNYTFKDFDAFFSEVNTRWCDGITKEWLTHWGKKVDIYWFDGCWLDWNSDCFIDNVKTLSPQAYFCCSCGESNTASEWLDGLDRGDLNYYSGAGGWGNPNFNITQQQFIAGTKQNFADGHSTIWSVGKDFRDFLICPSPAKEYFAAAKAAGLGFKPTVVALQQPAMRGRSLARPDVKANCLEYAFNGKRITTSRTNGAEHMNSRGIHIVIDRAGSGVLRVVGN